MSVVSQVGCMVVGASDLKAFCLLCHGNVEARTSSILAAMIASHCKEHPEFTHPLYVLPGPR